MHSPNQINLHDPGLSLRNIGKRLKKFPITEEQRKGFRNGFFTKNEMPEKSRETSPKDRILKIGFSWKKQSIKEIEKKPQSHPENPDPEIGFPPKPRNRR